MWIWDIDRVRVEVTVGHPLRSRVPVAAVVAEGALGSSTEETKM